MRSSLAIIAVLCVLFSGSNVCSSGAPSSTQESTTFAIHHGASAGEQGVQSSSSILVPNANTSTSSHRRMGSNDTDMDDIHAMPPKGSPEETSLTFLDDADELDDEDNVSTDDEGEMDNNTQDILHDDIYDDASDLGLPQWYEASDWIGPRLERARFYLNEIVRADDFYEPVWTACRNREEHCAFWAELGECDTNPTYMNTHCAPMVRYSMCMYVRDSKHDATFSVANFG
jgi:hypothetical protein